MNDKVRFNMKMKPILWGIGIFMGLVLNLSSCSEDSDLKGEIQTSLTCYRISSFKYTDFDDTYTADIYYSFYDGKNPTRRVILYDVISNGSINSSLIYTNTYDNKNNKTSEVHFHDSDYDGDTDSSHSYTYQNHYNNKGKIAILVVKYDDDNDGNTDSKIIHTNTYDSKGDLTKVVARYDDDNDGESESKIIYTYTYDSKGNLIKEVGKYDLYFFGDDTDFKWSYTYKNTYDSKGNLVKIVARYDDDINGTTDNRSTATYTFNSFECDDPSTTSTFSIAKQSYNRKLHSQSNKQSFHIQSQLHREFLKQLKLGSEHRELPAK